jgi:peptidyl-prolyl cis-trans isomerase A (cyclophilin A)
VNRFASLLIVTFVLIAGQIASGASLAQTKATSPTHHATATHARLDPALLHPTMLRARAPLVYEVKFVTTKGPFVIQVHREWAPNGADRFYNLVKHGFFTDASFFRVVPNFVVQFGMSANPRVNAVLGNSDIKDDPVRGSNKVGYVTFAQTGQPNSRSTQVFINLGDNSSLDSQNFAPFGQVTSGMEVIQQLYSGYGDLPEMGGHGPSQERIAKSGKAYLDRDFPKLDSIKYATVISPAAAPVHKPVHRTPAQKP